jgi:hypothetical protein
MDSEKILKKAYEKLSEGDSIREINGYFPIYSESDCGGTVDFCFHYSGKIIETSNNDGYVIVSGKTPEKRYAFDIGRGIIYGQIEVAEPRIFQRNDSIKRIAKDRTDDQKKYLYDFWNSFKEEMVWADVTERHINYALGNGKAIFYNDNGYESTPIIIREKADYIPMMVSLLEETDSLLPEKFLEQGSRKIPKIFYQRIYDHSKLFSKENVNYKENAVDYIFNEATKCLKIKQ